MYFDYLLMYFKYLLFNFNVFVKEFFGELLGPSKCL